MHLKCLPKDNKQPKLLWIFWPPSIHPWWKVICTQGISQEVIDEERCGVKNVEILFLFSYEHLKRIICNRQWHDDILCGFPVTVVISTNPSGIGIKGHCAGEQPWQLTTKSFKTLLECLELQVSAPIKGATERSRAKRAPEPNQPAASHSWLIHPVAMTR